MTFQNLQVALEDLPRGDALAFEPMAKSYPKEVLTQSLISWAIVLLISFVPFVAVAKPQYVRNILLLIPLGMGLLALLSIAFAWYGAKAKGIALREHDVAFRSGLFWKKTITLAFDRIQHIEIASGPLQRKFGLASLKFFTAGGMSVDMKIDGLTYQHAEQLRRSILERLQH